MGSYNLDFSWLVCLCWSWPALLHLRGDATRERPVVFQHKGKDCLRSQTRHCGSGKKKQAINESANPF